MTYGNTKQMGFWGFVTAWGSAVAVLGAGIAGVAAFFDLKLIPADSVVSVTEIHANYLHRSAVEAAYIEKVKIHQQYVSREEVGKILEAHIPVETVHEDYVTRQKYEVLAQENTRLKDELYGIPLPLKPIRRELSPRGKWHNERLGVLIEMKEYAGFEGHMNVVFALQLPDSPLHDEHVSDEKDSVRRWRFNKAGREFELVMERVYPPVFVLREM